MIMMIMAMITTVATMIIFDVAQPEVRQLFCTVTRLRRDDAAGDDDVDVDDGDDDLDVDDDDDDDDDYDDNDEDGDDDDGKYLYQNLQNP